MGEQSYEFSAKTVDAAIEEGLHQLGVARDAVDIQVLDRGSRGLLGIGSSPARVRISLRPRPEPEPAPPVEAAPPQAPAAPSEPPQPVEEPAAEKALAEAEPTRETPGEEAAEAPTEEQDQEQQAETGPEETGPEDEEEALADLAASILGQMLDLMGMDAQVEQRMIEAQDGEQPPIYLNIVGAELGTLIGRHGETLASIQYLVRLMVNQQVHHWANIVVDVDGYKERRAERLQQMAHRMADQVVQTGRAVSLEPMPPNERRLIHIALRDHPQVYTESTGEDDRRKVQILPK